MALKQILDKVAADLGFTGMMSNPDVLTTALILVNEAAEEIYEEQDLPGSLEEITVQATSNMRLALPYFVGELRAIRATNIDHYFADKWSLVSLRPRYVDAPWKSNYKTWRKIGDSPIKTEILNAAPIHFVVPAADPLTSVLVSGSTALADRVEEEVTLSSLDNVTQNSFTDFEGAGFLKSDYTDYNISVQDTNGTEIAMIPNNRLFSRYILVDVSTFPLYGTTELGKIIMDVLYKRPLIPFASPSDTFPVEGYDFIIANKVRQIWLENQPDRQVQAVQLAQRNEQKMNRKINNKEQDVNHQLDFGRNKYYNAMRLSGLEYQSPYRRIWPFDPTTGGPWYY